MKSDQDPTPLQMPSSQQHKYRKGQEIVAFQNIFTLGAAPGAT